MLCTALIVYVLHFLFGKTMMAFLLYKFIKGMLRHPKAVKANVFILHEKTVKVNCQVFPDSSPMNDYLESKRATPSTPVTFAAFNTEGAARFSWIMLEPLERPENAVLSKVTS